jgi:hypothetical protein
MIVNTRPSFASSQLMDYVERVSNENTFEKVVN